MFRDYLLLVRLNKECFLSFILVIHNKNVVIEYLSSHVICDITYLLISFNRKKKIF